MNHHFRTLVLCSALLLLTACSATYVPPAVTTFPATYDPAPVTLAGPNVYATTQKLSGAEHGRVIFITNCTACHEPQPIPEYSLADWNDKILPKMTVNANLKPDQIADLKAYIEYVHNLPPKPAQQ